MKLAPSRLFNYLTTLTIVGLAVWAAISLYGRYVEHPWTRDGQVRANVVGVAPRVSGPLIRVAVEDNQQVKKGDLLFEIDPSDYQAEVDVAAGQVTHDEAIFIEEKQKLTRETELYRTHVNSLEDFQDSQDAFGAARAQLAAAQATLKLARLKLGYTKVFAPVDGYVTNMNTSEGTYVTKGVQLITLVDTRSYWVAGYFKETQLTHIKVGQKAVMTMMGYENEPFQGVVRSIGWGIFVQDGSGNSEATAQGEAVANTSLLPSVSPTIDWVRLPQRFAVRIQVVGPTPVPLRIGQTVSIAMTRSFVPAASNRMAEK
jgi:multidrug resistance efflux pump